MRFFLRFAFSLLPLAAYAQFDLTDPLAGLDGDSAVADPASIHSEVSAIAAGKSFTLAITIPHPQGWHSYYKNSGGVELPPTLSWKLPSGFSTGPIQWPVPEIHPGDFGSSLSYEQAITLLVEITPPSELKPGSSVSIQVETTLQYCKPGQCQNSEASLSLDLPVATAASIDPAQSERFAKARANLPVSSDTWKFTATRERGKMKLIGATTSSLSPPIEVAFIPDQDFIQPFSFAPTSLEDGQLSLALKQGLVPFSEGEGLPIGKSFSGILVVKSASGNQSITVPETTFSKPPTPPLSFSSFLPILGGMLIGGLILNLMPCVFPVIGLKIMGFVQQAGEDRKKIILHGVAFALGVLVSFWILSGILFALRSSAGPGQEIGWGYQLQNPWTVLVLLLLMFVMALSMYGVFELGTSATGVGGKLQSKSGLSGSFFSGILATVVATPCSAPFLGAAIGAAIALPALQFFLAFTFMALGLALPYLILSIFPKLIDLLPRPGPWMESFKQAMAFLLFATAGFLLWVYVGQIKLENMLNVVIGLTMIAIAAWIFGRWHTPVRSARVRHIAKAFILLFAVGGLMACKPPSKEGVDWQVWSDERVEELLAEGTPVYIDFTAQWCATCQVNKKFAYTEEVIKLMKERGIVALKGDKTSPNPKVDAALEKLDRSAIPVNVLYVPGEDPVIAPEVLTPDYLKQLFGKVPATLEKESP